MAFQLKRLLAFIIFLVSITLSSSVNASANLLPGEFLEPLVSKVQLKAGETLYVDFWASWCVPCKKSFPWMNTLESKFQSKGLKILAINVDTDKDLAEQFLTKYPAKFPIFYDSDGKLAKAFDVQGMPSSFLLNTKGEILGSHKGFKTRLIPEYEKKISEVLNKISTKD